MFEDVYYTVYQITNLKNGKIYIGAHVTDDLEDGYTGSGELIQKAIEKYGVENFKKEYLVVFNNKHDMFEYERQTVDNTFVNRDDTYNLKEGGCGGWDFVNETMTTEQRKQIAKLGGLASIRNGCHLKASEKHSFLMKTDQTYRLNWIENNKNSVSPFKGQEHTESTKAKISQANSKNQQGAKNSQYGTCWINNPATGESKKIPKEDLSAWLDSGWDKGRQTAKLEDVVCPHCGKQGYPSVMKRWHFHNCKHIGI